MPQNPKDSIVVLDRSTVTFKYTHIFDQHHLVSRENILSHEMHAKDIWPSYLLFIYLGLFIFSLLALSKKQQLFLRSCFSIQASRSLEREEYKIISRESALLSILYIGCLSYLMFKVNLYFNIFPFGLDSLIQYFIFVLLSTLLYFIKFFYLSSMGFLLQLEKEVNEYRYNIFLTSQVAGSFLLLFCFALEFLQVPKGPVIISGLGCAAFFYMLRLLKGILISREIKGLSVFQLFIYLCTSEILPNLLLGAFLLRSSSYFL